MTAIPHTDQSPSPQRSAYARDPLDFYIEPVWASELLFRIPALFNGVRVIYDPCRGSGNVLKAATACGFEAIGDDIHPARTEFAPRDFKGIDDAYCNLKPRARFAIVSNPPYGDGCVAEEWFCRMLALKSPSVVAGLVQTRFLHSVRRWKFFKNHPPRIIAFLSSRPSCPPGEAFLAGDIEAKGGMQDYVWLIYTKRQVEGFPGTLWLKRDTLKCR